MHDKKRCQRGDVPVLCVFGRTKHGVKKLARQLADTGYPVAALQGNLSQNARNASWLTSAPDGCPSCCWRAAGIDRRAARSTDSGGRHDAHDNAAPVQGVSAGAVAYCLCWLFRCCVVRVVATGPVFPIGPTSGSIRS
jgi:hypothetical protein